MLIPPSGMQMIKSCLGGILLTFLPGGPSFDACRDVPEVDEMSMLLAEILKRCQ